MSKVSIGLRGWRFDEDELFDGDGFRSRSEMDDDTRQRLERLPLLLDQPCDVCYLGDGDDDATPDAVYGEPGAEVLVCNAHEPTFYYWFLEAGGDEHEGTAALQDAFHEWVAAGNREPDWYGGPEHVETDPDAVPDPGPDTSQLAPGEPVPVTVDLPEDEQAKLDLLEAADFDGVSDDLDIDADYPTSDE
ncbi:hypothetical protein PNP85_13095 [Halobacterium salinarum]|uniref:hypothetical protein n=1 Tax=Halobacterium TaxID=2239 RepID=UPI001962BC40|nr:MULTISPECIES: hypothetical protein [Halobacterium]MCF2165188.1 hypothetical protein [Halobacterium salinarum]MCF2168003.1 hypothetical protein [Halobacterium salinarum]MCF2207027.1 hypothetical protein [Halobacterium salinarum]MCF2238675.1 hypothetical protein [Halobacterium salinarum]MCF2241803.1 hypothetical protein [Halobacterium salinarum]